MLCRNGRGCAWAIELGLQCRDPATVADRIPTGKMALGNDLVT